MGRRYRWDLTEGPGSRESRSGLLARSGMGGPVVVGEGGEQAGEFVALGRAEGARSSSCASRMRASRRSRWRRPACALRPAGRARADPHPRPAGLVPGVPRRGGTAVPGLPSGDPVHPRLRLLRAGPRARLGRRPRRPRMGRADAPSRLRAVRGAGRRLRLGHLAGAGRGGAGAGGRRAREPPAHPAGPGRRRHPEPLGRGPAGQGAAADGEPPAVPGPAGHDPADARLRADRLAGGPSGVDRGTVRAVDRSPDAGERRADPDRRLAVPADRHGGLVGTAAPRVGPARRGMPGAGGGGGAPPRHHPVGTAAGGAAVRHPALVGVRPGGHFAAMEVPGPFAEDVRTFFLGPVAGAGASVTSRAAR